MLRLTEIKLPLAHAENALQDAILHTLHITAGDLTRFTVFKRSFDARKAVIMQVYIVDVALSSAALEAALLARHAGHPHIFPTPDMAYHLVGSAPASLPLVSGAVVIAPGGKHLVLRGSANAPVAGLSDAPPENGCRPAADVRGRVVRHRRARDRHRCRRGSRAVRARTIVSGVAVGDHGGA
jgi:hypothetical protein